MSYFGDQILQLRKKEGLSQEEFAYRIGVSRQIVSRWENGVAIPRTTKVKTICDEFNVTPNSLFGTTDSKDYIDNEKDENESKEKKKRISIRSIIAILVSIILFLYLLFFIHNTYLLNVLDKTFKEYDKWTNYYAEIEFFSETETTNKYKIWYKDNYYKIIVERFEDGVLANEDKRYVDCNSSTNQDTDLSGTSVELENDNTISRIYNNGSYIKQFFPWIYDVEKNKINLALSNRIKIAENKRKVIEIGRKVLVLDEDSMMPDSFSDMSKGKIKFINYNITLNCVNDEDIKKDL